MSETSFIVSRLQPSTTYILYVRANTSKGPGESASVEAKTHELGISVNYCIRFVNPAFEVLKFVEVCTKHLSRDEGVRVGYLKYFTLYLLQTWRFV